MESVKDVIGYEGLYKVTSCGKVYGKNNKIILGWNTNGVYKKVRLYVNKKCKDHYVHRLVAASFILNIENKPNINHKDNDPSNNNYLNLEWCTQKENIAYSAMQGRMGKHGKRIRHIETGLVYDTIDAASKDVGVNPNTLVYQLKRKSKKCKFISLR